MHDNNSFSSSRFRPSSITVCGELGQSRAVGPGQHERAEIRYCDGFTLTELWVVKAITAVLGAVSLPVFGKAKLKAQGLQCLNNHRQLCMAA